MFFFERDVSGRLILAARKHLPDSSGVPSLLAFLKRSQFRLKNVILAMVRRGDFNVAVRKLADLLKMIAEDYRYDFSPIDSERVVLGIDSLFVVLEALLAAFTQQMVQQNILPESTAYNLEPNLNPLYGIYTWTCVARVPPLDRALATDLLTFMVRVMPNGLVDEPLATSLTQSLPSKLGDLLLSMSQYIYMANPMVIHEAMARAMAEWDPPARVDFMLLSPTDSEMLERYLRLARSYLPRLDSNGQHKLMKLVFTSMMRGTVSNPSCSWATGPAASNAIRGFENAVEKSRPFRALRAFRSHEALAITMMEILRLAAANHHTAHTPTSPRASPISSVLSHETSTDEDVFHNLHRSSSHSPQGTQTSLGPPLKQVSPTHQTSQPHHQHHNQDQHEKHHDTHQEQHSHNSNHSHQHHAHHKEHHHHHHAPALISVAHVKIFERAISLIKRDNPADKRVGSRLAAAEYLICIGGLGWIVSERPGGEQFRGLARDILPYLSLIAEDLENLNEQYRALYLSFCSRMAPSDFKKLCPKLSFNMTLHMLQVLSVASNPSSFVDVLVQCNPQLREYLYETLNNKDCDSVFPALNMIVNLPSELLPIPMVQDILFQLTSYFSRNCETEYNRGEILESYITILVSRVGPAACMGALTPLIPSDSPAEILHNPRKIKPLYQLLRLLSHGWRIVPVEHLEGEGLLASKVRTLRITLMLCLCSDSTNAIEVALKCLELLQSDLAQSPVERDLVSELLDSMDQSLPSTSVMQKRMSASLAADPDPSFLPFNKAIRDTLDSIKDRPISHKLHVNLLRMRTATLSLEPPATRASFYSDFVLLDGKLLQSVSGSIPLGSRLASEFFRAITRMNGSSLARIGPINGSQLSGKCRLYIWLLNCLETEHPSSAAELRLGEICARAVASLSPHSASNYEICVLNLLEKAANYAAKDEIPQATSILFSQVVNMVLDRSWEQASSSYLASALAAVFKHYKEPDVERLKAIVNQILTVNLESVQIPILTSLLNENLSSLIRLYDGMSSLSDVYRASIYEALSKRYNQKKGNINKTWGSGDFVMFLLENKAMLMALSDVCSVNGDDGVSSAIVQLFRTHSKAAERRLVEISIDHEVEGSSCPSDLFRSNSVTMKVLLEWLRSVSSSYLNGVLSPALGSLRSASIRDDADMESLFDDAVSRFKSKQLPIHLQWLLCLVRESVTPKFGKETAIQSISVLMVLRFICPAVVAPHRFGVARRPPARHFATILRKFAIYLQRRRDTVCEFMAYFDSSKPAINGSSGMLACKSAADYESLISEKDGSKVEAKVEFDDQYTSATRQVYHFLRRHSVEVRVVLLSHGYGEIVAKMLRYFRIGSSATYFNSSQNEQVDSDAALEENETGKESRHIDTFMGQKVISVPARNICSEDGISKYAVHEIGSHTEPTVIDFTDFSGLFDRWAEFMLYMAFSASSDRHEGYKFYAFNCPRRTKSVINRLKELVSLPVEIVYYTSLDFNTDSDLPSNLPDVKLVVADIAGAVRFHVQVRSGPTVSVYDAELFVGAKYLQIIGDGSCDVLPYVTSNMSKLSVRLTRGELNISTHSCDFTIFSPTSSLIRVLGLSLAAVDAEKLGANVDLKSPDYEASSPMRAATTGQPASLADSSMELNDQYWEDNHVKSIKHDATHEAMKRPNSSNRIHDTICPGRLLFSALNDAMHESPEVRRRALELYGVLPESLGLQLSVPSPQQTLMPNQVFALAASAAKRHPELALCVASGLATLGTRITERAAQIAAPWIPFLIPTSAEYRKILRSRVLQPLLQAVSDAPSTVGPVLLEYFWPLLRDLPTLSVDLLLETSIAAPPESLEALRQILACGISADRPHESREFAEALLARLYSRLRSDDSTSTKWSQHPDWRELKVCVILFASVAVDWQAAELLFPEVSFVMLIFAGVGTPQLRSAVHQLLINYVNAFLQSPNSFPAQRQRLLASRAELTGPRGSVLFGVQKDIHGQDPIWVSDDYTEHTPEMQEHLGRIVSDISIAVFSNRLSGYQETRVAIAFRVMEFIDVKWPPLQRRCILSLVGAVRFLMPDSVVSDLIQLLGSVLSEPGTLETRSVLVASFLRMFSETIECIPDTGVYHQYLFWLSVVALATGCVAIQADAVRLLRESIKIAHFRGSFREKTVAQIYLSVKPSWSGAAEEDVNNMLPLDIPTTEANFHIALGQLLVSPLQQAESQMLALECCDVLATACPTEFVYAAFLYLGGEDGSIATRVPTGAFVDTEDAVSQWLASRVRHEDASSVLSLALCAEFSGFSRSMNFSQTGPRLLDLVLQVKDRHVVNMISPLLRPIFLRLLKLDDRAFEIGLNKCSLYLFSKSPEERQEISANRVSLNSLVKAMNLRPWFDETYKIHPLFFEDSFTETTRQVLCKSEWIHSAPAAKLNNGESGSSQHPFENEKLF